MSADAIAFPLERDARPTRVSPLKRRLVAPNGGPFTYTGTHAYIAAAVGLGLFKRYERA